MVMPTPFGAIGENALPSYDWKDFIANAGYKTFYPAMAKTNAATEYFLSTEQIDADYIDGYSISVDDTNTELNFDITFQTPAIVGNGDITLNYTNYATTGAQSYCIATIYHVRGVTETSMGTVTSTTMTSTGSWWIRRLLKIPITSHSFAIGDKLRLELKVYSAGGLGTAWYFDPSGRQSLTESGTGATITASMTLDVPFKVDL